MPTLNRRAAGRRRAWGRGPIILRFESLERRELLAASSLPDLAGASLVTVHQADWGDPVAVQGTIVNQGGTTVTVPFEVELYASPSIAIGRYAVPLGSVTIPAGLAPAQSVPFSTSVTLPTTPLPGVATNGIVYIDMKIDPTDSVDQSNRRTDSGLGAPYESSYITITPPEPAVLQGSTLAVSAPTTTWGSTITVTAQVQNNGAGASPPTQALLALTPTGTLPEWPNDVSIGTLNVPAIPPYQSVNLVQTITLPANLPNLLTSTDGNTAFTLSMIQDAEYVTNANYPHLPSVGLGYDMVNMTISPSPTATASTAPLPDLASGSVLVSANALSWGETFQVTTAVQNLGQGDAGPFTVRFLLVGENGNVNTGIFLGDAQIPGLAGGYNQPLVQTLSLPSRVPAGMSLNSVGYARIAVIVDAENTVNESLISNNLGESAPLIVRLPGTNGTSVVPTTASTGLASLKAPPAPKKKPEPKRAEARAEKAASEPLKKLHRRPAKTEPSIVHDLTSLPTKVNDLIKKYV